MTIIQMFVPLFSSPVAWKDVVLPRGLRAANVGWVVPVHGSSPGSHVAEPVGVEGGWNLWLSDFLRELQSSLGRCCFRSKIFQGEYCLGFLA